MNPGIVQRIFQDHFSAYRKKRLLSPREHRAAYQIMTCRTPDQGYHIDACPNGDYEIKLNNSCKHRSCPQCGATETELWLERRRKQALNCRYFHVIFTISHDLHGLWRCNRKAFTNRMMRAAWHSLHEMLTDWRWLGGLPGAVAVFQSWDDELKEHCHLHFIITAGGLNPDKRWVSIRDDFLVPTPALAAKFRGKFLAYLRDGLEASKSEADREHSKDLLFPPPGMSRQQCFNLLNKLGRIRWHADIEPPYEHANGVFKYLGRYIRRGPISEKRIKAYDGENVTIGYAHPEKHDRKCFTLQALTFVDRLLRHVPEKGSHLVRSYGLFHPNCRGKLNAARERLAQPPYEPMRELPSAVELLRRMHRDPAIGRCPECGQELETVFHCRGGPGEYVKRAA